MYDQVLQYYIPPGDQPLKGSEAELIKAFKELLQLTDEDAAPVHMEVGRRFSRSRLEVGTNKDLAMEERRAFQKLIYISRLVFGEQKSAFLLPWVRVFNMSPNSIELAIKSNAKQLFKSSITASGGKLLADPKYLQNLKSIQDRLQLDDESCAEIVRESAQERVVEWLDVACECVKRRGRTKDYGDAMNAVHALLEFNEQLQLLKLQQEALPDEQRTLVPGLGRVAVYGTKYETQPGLSNDLRDVFRVYLEESLRIDGLFTEKLEKEVEELKVALALGAKDSDRVIHEVKSRVYKSMLREEFTSGRLDAAPKKDAILNELVQKIRFDGPTAMDLHMSLYQQKLESILEDKKISDEQEAELDRLRRLLCIPQPQWKSVNDKVQGRIFEDTLQAIMEKQFSKYEDSETVKKCLENTRIDRVTAKQILKDVCVKELQKFMAKSRMQRDRLSQAKELKEMVFFSNTVISPLLDVLNEGVEKEQEDQKDKAMQEFADIMKQAQKEADLEKQKAEEDGDTSAQEATEEQTVTPETTQSEQTPVAAEASSVDAEKVEATEGAVKEADKEPEAEDYTPRTLAKAKKAAKDREGGEVITTAQGDIEMKSQKEINLGDVLTMQDREDTYKLYLMYTMSGDVIAMPMGGQIVVERDEQEFARLSQLGDILGLGQFEVAKIHQGMAEQAFKAQVEAISSGGDLFGKENRDKVEELRKQMQLTEDAANKIIKGIQNKKLLGNLQAYKAQGALNYQKLLDLKADGVEVGDLVSKDIRTQIFKREMEDIFTSGSRHFDKDQLYTEIAGNLALPKETVDSAIKNYADDKRQPVFVQAAAYLRQRNFAGVTKSLNNYVNISKALGATDVPEWDHEELQDMYGVYCLSEKDDDLRKTIQTAMGLKDEEVSALHEMVTSGAFKFDQEKKEEAFF
eukprot:TRINITY_DN3342_c0_g1_i4.p1 TRINITY_DN3342_c0_g1~~TRINITY_DN3342_c0_g1_i4.p1  ORF type:complete len:1032 (-),score=267.67 TRINITY_DN3342_c0_g1_i4:1577-4321(-)